MTIEQKERSWVTRPLPGACRKYLMCSLLRGGALFFPLGWSSFGRGIQAEESGEGLAEPAVPTSILQGLECESCPLGSGAPCRLALMDVLGGDSEADEEQGKIGSTERSVRPGWRGCLEGVEEEALAWEWGMP